MTCCKKNERKIGSDGWVVMVEFYEIFLRAPFMTADGTRLATRSL